MHLRQQCIAFLSPSSNKLQKTQKSQEKSTLSASLSQQWNEGVRSCRSSWVPHVLSRLAESPQAGTALGTYPGSVPGGASSLRVPAELPGGRAGPGAVRERSGGAQAAPGCCWRPPGLCSRQTRAMPAEQSMGLTPQPSATGCRANLRPPA